MAGWDSIPRSASRPVGGGLLFHSARGCFSVSFQAFFADLLEPAVCVVKPYVLRGAFLITFYGYFQGRCHDAHGGVLFVP